jgi:hypothetical protein
MRRAQPINAEQRITVATLVCVTGLRGSRAAACSSRCSASLKLRLPGRRSADTPARYSW